MSEPTELRGGYRLLVSLVNPEGSIKLLGLANHDTVSDVTPRIAKLGDAFRQRDVFTTWSIVDTAAYTQGIVTGLQALGSAFFRPNLLAHTVSSHAVDRGPLDLTGVEVADGAEERGGATELRLPDVA